MYINVYIQLINKCNISQCILFVIKQIQFFVQSVPTKSVKQERECYSFPSANIQYTIQVIQNKHKTVCCQTLTCIPTFIKLGWCSYCVNHMKNNRLKVLTKREVIGLQFAWLLISALTAHTAAISRFFPRCDKVSGYDPMCSQNENDEVSEVGIKHNISQDCSIRCRVSGASTWYDMSLHCLTSTNTVLNSPVLHFNKNRLDSQSCDSCIFESPEQTDCWHFPLP